MRKKQSIHALGLFFLALLVVCNTLPVKAQNGTIWYGYTHLWADQPHANVGDVVHTGDVIGQVGPIATSGYGNADHLHFMATHSDPTSINQANLTWIFEDPAGVIPPLEGPLNQGSFPFGGANGFDYQGKHTGTDYLAAAGTNVLAVCDGTVVWWDDWPWGGAGSWMNTIWLKCDGGVSSDEPDKSPSPRESQQKTRLEKVIDYLSSKKGRIQKTIRSLIAWVQNNQPSIKIPKPIPDPAEQAQTYQFSVLAQSSDQTCQKNVKTFFAWPTVGKDLEKLKMLDYQHFEGSWTLPPNSTQSVDKKFGPFEAKQGMEDAPGPNGPGPGNCSCNAASMVRHVLLEEGLNAEANCPNHPTVAGVPEGHQAYVCIPSAKYPCAQTCDITVKNPFSYPLLLHWRVDGDTINMWVEKEVVEVPSDSGGKLPNGLIWAIVLLVPVIIGGLLVAFAPHRAVEGVIWVSKRTPSIIGGAKEAAKLAIEWWVLLMAAAFVMQPTLRAIVAYGFSQWLKGKTTIDNWQIAVITVAFGLNVLLRRYFYAKQVRRDGGYYVETPPRRGCLSTVLATMTAIAIVVVLTVVLAGKAVAKIQPTPPFTGNCEVSDNAPQAIRQWCDLITLNAKSNWLDPNLVAAVIQQESGGDPNAISSCDAVGLMQVIPSNLTPKTIACGAIDTNGHHVFSDRKSMAELVDPTTNVEEGTRILGKNLKVYGSYREALKAYGPTGVGYAYADTVLGIFQSWTGHLPGQ